MNKMMNGMIMEQVIKQEDGQMLKQWTEVCGYGYQDMRTK